MRLLKNDEFFEYLTNLVLNAKYNIILDFYVIDISSQKVKELMNIITLKKTELDNLFIYVGGVEDVDALYTNCFLYFMYKKSLDKSLVFLKKQSHSKLALVDNVLVLGSHNLTDSSSENISVALKINIDEKKNLMKYLMTKEKMEEDLIETLCKTVTIRRPSRRKSPYNLFVK